jgi:hypothetical protein
MAYNIPMNMQTVTIQLPKNVYERVRSAARVQGVVSRKKQLLPVVLGLLER